MDYNEIIEEIKCKADLAAIVSQKTRLTRKGKDFWGLCPFHQEKTPSFKVDQQAGSWYCFGCQAGGSVFDFVMREQGITFSEAIQVLAQRLGLQIDRQPLTPAQKQRQEERQRLLHILALSGKFYQEQLSAPAGAGARRYLIQRNISQNTATDFALGYAPDSWDELCRYLDKQGSPAALAVKAGVLAAKEGKSGARDRFRNRIIFPICDSNGQIISFGGRALGQDHAKYLNGPETLVFKKGQNLFNLHRARKHARERGRIILVEGYFDVITLSANGIGEVVAQMGTALKPEQIILLNRQSQDIVLAFDGDEAGRKAAAKALGLFMEASINPQVLWLPEGEDPDSLVRKQGVEALHSRLAHTVPLIQGVLDAAIKQENSNTPEGKSALVRDCGRIIKAIKDRVLQSGYVDYVAKRLNLPLTLINGALGLPAPGNNQPPFRRITSSAEALTNPRLFVESALSGPESARRIAQAGILESIEDEQLKPIAEALMEIVRSGDIPDADNLLLHLASQPLLCQQVDAMARRAPKEDLQTLQKQITSWENKDLKKQISSLNNVLAQNLSTGDYEQAKLVHEKIRILRERIRIMTKIPCSGKD
jgi:DNA primase